MGKSLGRDLRISLQLRKPVAGMCCLPSRHHIFGYLLDIVWLMYIRDEPIVSTMMCNLIIPVLNLMKPSREYFKEIYSLYPVPSEVNRKVYSFQDCPPLRGGDAQCLEEHAEQEARVCSAFQ